MGDPGKRKWIARQAAVSTLRYALALVPAATTLDSANTFFNLLQRFTPPPTKVEADE